MNAKKNKLAYLAGILGGLLFSLPWLLVFAFLEVSSGYLAFLIVFGIIFGYKKINKEIYNEKKTYIYLATTSIFIVFLGVFVLIPMITYGSSLSLKKLEVLYENKDFLSSILINFILALVMALIPSLLFPIDFKKKEYNKTESEFFIDEIRRIFEKHNALTRENAVDKKIIKEEIKNINLGKFKKSIYVDVLKNNLIRTYKGKWYLVDNQKNKIKIGLLLSIFLLIIFVSCWNITMNTYNDTNYNTNNNQTTKVEKAKLKEYKLNDNASILMPDCMKLNKEEKQDNNTYYQYISVNTNKSNIEMIEMYYYPSYKIDSWYEDFKKSVNDSLKDYNILTTEDRVVNNNKVLYFKLDKLSLNYISNVYFASSPDSLFEVYIHVNNNKYSEEDDVLSDKIIESIN